MPPTATSTPASMRSRSASRATTTARGRRRSWKSASPASPAPDAHMATASPPAEHIVVERDGAIVTLTFNRPEARNAMTWEMYRRLGEVCDEVDRDDAVRVLVLRGAGGKAFVAGTDIAQFLSFQSGEDGLRYERDVGEFVGRVARVAKPVIAQIEGFAVGGGFGIAAACDLRVATPGARVRELAEQVASHAPITLMVTKEAIRRIHEARALPDGDDLIAKTYGSADFREGVRAFV